MCTPAHRDEQTVKGTEERRRGMGLEEWKKLLNEQQLAEGNSHFSPCLLCHIAHSDPSHSSNSTPESPPSPFESRRNQYCLENKEGVPQQQRKTGWLALPAQKWECIYGHVELSYVPTCLSTPSPLLFHETAGEKLKLKDYNFYHSN